MLAQKDPARRRAAGSSERVVKRTQLAPNSLRNQVVFVADRHPDCFVAAQPYWRIGCRDQITIAGTTTRLELLVSLCAKCGEPFFTTRPTVTAFPLNLNRRCVEHHRRGVAVKTYLVKWAVRAGGHP